MRALPYAKKPHNPRFSTMIQQEGTGTEIPTNQQQLIFTPVVLKLPTRGIAPGALIATTEPNIPTTWNIFSQHNPVPDKTPRAVIFVINKSWSPLVIKDHRDIVTIAITTAGTQLLLTGAYASPAEDLDITLQEINHNLQSMQVPQVICGDFNAQNRLWGYHFTSPRGLQMEDLIHSQNLILHNNSDDSPTFETINGKGWPDLLLTTHHLINNITNRKISDDHSNSDHHYITFEVNMQIEQIHTMRFKINQQTEKKFTKSLRRIANNILQELATCNSKDEINASAENTTRQIQELCQNTLKIKKANQSTRANWWTKDLRAARQKQEPSEDV
ncbi:uncharacterized protein LOC118202634 [Stegodyphus dumicola]|uniref:uncharacterized protein LOC118202634 n=1 Tax=Stegodyphus dumicola TaxID=202533 RepID=UPI0015ACF671|nr:uncharacterized protein LOC118202634 [Stegodyphus dumicola]